MILKTNKKRDIPKGVVAQTAGILSDMETSGKEFVEDIRKDSGRRLDSLENNS
ncbi:hypothetical protein [Desulfofalx alkaliphila]|uniref:hypothetical protein n=1 Tax=Desulfofalx alkaliphila TaxID=105483 RepID=UPI000AA9FD06|nr:hypothetical protein [Desulfofalx alkaliphila]